MKQLLRLRDRLAGAWQALNVAVSGYLGPAGKSERLATLAILIRLVLLYGLLARFGLNRSDLSSPALLAAVRLLALFLFAYALALVYLRLNRPEVFFSNRSRHWQILIDAVLFSALYFLGRDAESDIFLVYLLPLLLAVDYLSLRWALVAFILVSGAYAGTTYLITDLFTGYPEQVLIRAIVPRALFFAGTVLGYWMLRRLNPATLLEHDRARLARASSAIGDEVYLVGDGYKLLWVSPELSQRHGRAFRAKICYAYLAGRSGPCSGCPLAVVSQADATEEGAVSLKARVASGLTYDAQITVCRLRGATEPRAVGILRDMTAQQGFVRELDAYAARVDELAEQQANELAGQIRRIGGQLTGFLEAARLSVLVDQNDEESLNAILERFGTQLGSILVTLRTLDLTGQRGLVLIASYSAYRAPGPEVKNLPLDADSLVTKAFKTRLPQACLDVQDSVRPVIHFVAQAFRGRQHSMISFPLLIHGEPIGTCTFYRDQILPYDAKDRELGQAMANLLAIVLDNLQSYRAEMQRTRERQEWLNNLQQLSESLSGYEPLDTIMHRALDHTMTRLGAETAAIFLWDAGRLRRKAIVGLPDGWFIEESYGFGEGLTGRVVVPVARAKYGQPVLCNEVDQDLSVVPSNLDHYRQALPSHQVKHLIAVPLNARDGSVGVLRVVNRKGAEENGLAAYGFDTRHVDLLSLIAAPIAMTIENNRLFEAEKKRRTLQEQLSAAALAVISSLELEDVLEQILLQIEAVIPYDSASVQILKPDGFHIVACRGFDSMEAVKALVFPLTSDFPNTRLAHRQEACIIDDVRTDYSHFSDPGWHAIHVRSWLGVPLRHRDELVGMIALDSRTPGFYSDEHANIALGFATQASIALVHADLHKNTSRQAQRNAQLVDVARKLISLSDPKDLTRSLVESTLPIIDRADGVVLHRLDPASGKLRRVSSDPEEFAARSQSPMRLGHGIAGIALQTRETVRVSDVTLDDRFQEAAHLNGLRSLVVAPLYVANRKRIGTLSVYSSQACAFDEADEAMLTTLASLAGVAWANIELLQTREELRRRTEQLLEAASEFDIDVGLKELCSRIGRIARDVLKWRAVAIKILDAQNDRFVVQLALSACDSQSPELSYTPHSIQVVQEMIRDAPRLGHCYWVRGAYDRMRHREVKERTSLLDEAGLPMDWGPGDALLVPLETSAMGLMGYLAVAEPEKYLRPSTEDVQAIELLAQQAAVAIARTLLYEHTAEQRRRLEEYLSVLGPRLGAVEEVTALGGLIAQAVVGFLGATACSLWLTTSEGMIECVGAVDLDKELTMCSSLPVTSAPHSGLIPYVAATHQVLNFVGKEYAQHSAYNGDPALQNDAPGWKGSQSLLLVPLVNVNGSCVGVLRVENKQSWGMTTGFSNDDVTFLTTLAGPAAADVDRLRLRQRIAVEMRRRLESELHEAMNVLATGVRWEIDTTQRAFENGSRSDVEYGLQRMRMASKRAYEDLNYILKDLRNPVLEKEGLVAALLDFAATIGQGKVHFVPPEPFDRLPPGLEHALFRVGQEAISNALKHSGVMDKEQGEVKVDIAVDEEMIILTVSDNGCGFDVEQVMQKKGPTGITRMREWADDAGITYRVKSESGVGTVVEAHVHL